MSLSETTLTQKELTNEQKAKRLGDSEGCDGTVFPDQDPRSSVQLRKTTTNKRKLWCFPRPFTDPGHRHVCTGSRIRDC